MKNIAENRRQFPRVPLPAMYTRVRVRRLDEEAFSLEGHAYDVSEGGLMFELDRGIDPGTSIAVEIELPNHGLPEGSIDGPGRAVFAFGNVVWCDDTEPGPVWLALAFTHFPRAGDRDRLMNRLRTLVATRRAA